MESLCFDCVECPINFDALERLVARSPMLKKLRLNRYVSIGQLYRLALRAPQLTHLGTGSFSQMENIGQQGDNQEVEYESAFAACRSIVCLSGFREISPEYLPTIYPVCANLTSLNLSYANVDAEQLKPAIRRCHKLQVFLVSFMRFEFKLVTKDYPCLSIITRSKRAYGVLFWKIIN